MTYTMTRNPQFDSLEIAFDGKPSEAIREALKELKFRWHGVKKVWYGYADEETAKAAIEGKPHTVETVKAVKAPKVDKDFLRDQFSKAWSDARMIDYCVNKVAAVATLPNGDIITIDKQGIETRFCFGESGYDFDEAAEAANVARTSQDYFKRENMASFKKWIDNLTDVLNGTGNYMLTIGERAYTGQAEDCKLRFITFDRITDIIEACGGSAYLEELPGKELFVNGKHCRIATAEEIKIILDAYTEAANAHEKKVDSYLKRYGTSKVHSWTYWRDA